MKSIILASSAMSLALYANTAWSDVCDPTGSDVCVGQGYDSAGADSIDAIVVNADSDGNGPGLFAVVVGSDYDGYGNNVDGSDPGTTAQFRVQSNSVIMNRNTSVSGSNTLTVGGTTITNGLLDVNAGITGENFSVANDSGNTNIGGTLTVTGETTTNGLLDVNGGIEGENFSVANDNGNTSIGGTLTVTGETTANGLLDVNAGIEGENFTVANDSGNTSIGGTLTVDDDFRLDTNGSSAQGTTIVADDSSLTMASQRTVLRGGTNSGILTLQDGDTGNGTTLEISGSTGGTAATVLQTTTNATTTQVNTSLGSSDTAYTQQTVVQAGANALRVSSGESGAEAGVTISGTVSGTNTSNVGVLLTGDGRNGLAYDPQSATSPPDWADIRIQSANYGGENPAIGNAIIVTDYGIQMANAAPAENSTMFNRQGNNSGEGVIDNEFGLNAGNGTVLNSIGNAAPTSGTSSSVLNEIGANDGDGSVTTRIGGGSSPTENLIGNANAATQTTAVAGASSMALRDSSAVLTGGQRGNRMTLDDFGATFASGSGDPITVTGVLDGGSEFDAVNVGQFASAIAATAAMSAIPDIRPGHSSSFGMGLGTHMGYEAFAFGGKSYIGDQAMIQYSGATGTRDFDAVYSVGIGWSW